MYNMESRTPKMRTIDQAIADIKERDANTAITKMQLRDWLMRVQFPLFVLEEKTN